MHDGLYFFLTLEDLFSPCRYIRYRCPCIQYEYSSGMNIELGSDGHYMRRGLQHYISNLGPEEDRMEELEKTDSSNKSCKKYRMWPERVVCCVVVARCRVVLGVMLCQ